MDGNDYDGRFHIVLDLEMTCFDDPGMKELMEPIEIGAVCLDGRNANLTEWSVFHSFVRPVNNPFLTDLCKNVTNVTQDMVDSADVFSEVWGRRFVPWLNSVNSFASWGRSDLSWLRQACAAHGVFFPFTHHCNLFSAFGSGQRRVLRRNKMTWSGARHRAFNDALTYARLVQAEKPTLKYKGIS